MGNVDEWCVCVCVCACDRICHHDWVWANIYGWERKQVINVLAEANKHISVWVNGTNERNCQFHVPLTLSFPTNLLWRQFRLKKWKDIQRNADVYHVKDINSMSVDIVFVVVPFRFECERLRGFRAKRKRWIAPNAVHKIRAIRMTDVLRWVLLASCAFSQRPTHTVA